jgi:hypothetical protein
MTLINWAQVPPGYSVFIPLLRASKVLVDVKHQVEALGIPVGYRMVVHNKQYGLMLTHLEKGAPGLKNEDMKGV